MKDKKEKNTWEEALEQGEKEQAAYTFGVYPAIQDYMCRATAASVNEFGSKMEELREEIETLKHLNGWFEEELHKMAKEKFEISDKIKDHIKFEIYMLLQNVFDTCIKAVKEDEEE